MSLKCAQPLCCMLFAMFQKEQPKSIGAKAAHKMMVKLIPGVDFANILHAPFA